MSNGKREMIPADPPARIALPTVEDAAEMKRRMRGVTTSRSAGMAHQTAEKAMRKRKKVAKKR